MKNKRVLGMIGALLAVILVAVVYPMLTNKKDANKTDGTKKVKVGVLQLVSHPSLDEIYKGIQDGLAEEGYDKDQVEIDFLNAEGDQNKVATMSKQLVQNNNDVLIGIATPSAQGLASATKDKPIVMGAITDPVGANLVKDLKKPGGNITGVSDHNPTEQQLKLIKELTPNVKTIGVLYSTSEDNSKTQVEEFTKLAEKAGYKVVPYSVPSTNEIASTVSVMTGKVDALHQRAHLAHLWKASLVETLQSLPASPALIWRGLGRFSSEPDMAAWPRLPMTFTREASSWPLAVSSSWPTAAAPTRPLCSLPCSRSPARALPPRPRTQTAASLPAS